MKPITTQRELRQILDTQKAVYGGQELVDYEHQCGIMRTNPDPSKVLTIITNHLTPKGESSNRKPKIDREGLNRALQRSRREFPHTWDVADIESILDDFLPSEEP